MMEVLLLMSNVTAPLENHGTLGELDVLRMFSGCSRAMGSEKEGGRMATHAPARDLGIDTKQLH